MLNYRSKGCKKMSDKCPTPHNSAICGDFAKTVLMPGDPKRARFIASQFLDGARLVNDVRGISGYTGRFKGVPVSVMASGMGMPSIGIYSYELFNFYGVENIIRVGSAGSLNKDVKLRDVVLGMGACTNSAYASQYRLPGSFAPVADFALLRKAYETAQRLGAVCHVGNLLSSDTFYNDFPEDSLSWARMGVLAVEMEAAALYMNAARCGKKALAICTVSDSLVTGESTSSEEREKTFTQMINIALETAVSEELK